MNPTRRRKVSEYGLQMREKQRVRRSYSVVERQFRNYLDAARQKGMTGENLLRMLEMRLDNVVYRMGFATSRAQARQLVTHGHFNVNGRATKSPSRQIAVGDRIEVRDTRRSRTYFQNAPEFMRSAQSRTGSADPTKLSGSVIAEPTREQMPMEFNEQLVVEYYSR